MKAKTASASRPNTKVLQRVLTSISDPSHGLPDDVFQFTLAVTPMVNVDLLVVDTQDRVLMAWREDEFGDGWHVPGGIVRFREKLLTRIAAVARAELGAIVLADEAPCAVLSVQRQLVSGEAQLGQGRGA